MSTTREKILATATKLFIEHGFAQTTIRDICTVAKVNLAAVNYHFKSKQQLIETIICTIVEKRSQSKLKVLSDRTVSNEQEWQQVIIDFINSMVLDDISGSKNDFILIRQFMNELQSSPKFFSEVHHKYFEPLDRELIRYIKMGLSPSAPPGSAALWLMTINSQCISFRQHCTILNTLSEDVDFSQPQSAKLVATHIANSVFASLKYHKK